MSSFLTDEQREEFAALWARLERSDLVGGTIETFYDCGFDSMSHKYIRATIVSATWKDGRPSIIRSVNPFAFTNTGHNPIEWKPIEGEAALRLLYLNYEGARSEPEAQIALEVLPDIRDIVNVRDGCYDFYWPNGRHVTIYPSHVPVPSTPSNYQGETIVKGLDALSQGKNPNDDKPSA